MDWTSTKDNLPPDGMEVFIKYKGIEYIGTFFQAANAFDLFTGGQICCNLEEIYWISTGIQDKDDLN